MVPLYIKGFLPQQTGSAIMLPAEITKLSGSDFDVDKLYIMLPEFNINKYDTRLAKEIYRKEGHIAKGLAEMFKGGMGLGDELSQILEEDDDYKDWFNRNKERFILPKEKWITKIKYDYNKKPQEQSLKARNNAIIDMMWGVLTNPDTVSKMFNPGGFDDLKVADRIVNILDSATMNDLKKEGVNDPNELLNLPLKTLNKLANKYKRKPDPLSPRTQVILHQQNMTGGKMIGVYANHNANHALIQHTQLGVDNKNGSFIFNGKKETSLHQIKNRKGKFISRNNATFLGASVDNVKDNTLYGTNQNSFTVDVTMLLSRLGYEPYEIAVLLRQPIIMEMTKKYFRESREGKSADTIIEEVIKDTAKFAGMHNNLSYDNIRKNTFELGPLMQAIMNHKDVLNMSDKDRIEHYRQQVTVGLLFQRMFTTASALKELVNATRADTTGGAAGPSIADTMVKIQKVKDLLDDMRSKKYPLTGASIIYDRLLDTEDENSMREALLNSPLPFLQAFYTLGIRMTERLLQDYFPHYTQSFTDVMDEFVARTKSGKLSVKTRNLIYNDLYAYIMSKLPFFGNTVDKSGKNVSAREKRNSFINNFPAYFNKIVEENEDIASLEFIKRLKPQRSNNKNPISVLVFKNVGSLTPILRERYMRDWTTLLTMENPKAQELGLNLFLYSYFRNGFAFGPSTFIHLASSNIRKAIPGYIETLRELLTLEDSYMEFLDQFIYNHLDNRELVPEIPDNATTEFTNKDGNIKEEVTIFINESSTSGDKVAVQKTVTVEGEKVNIFMEYIGKNIKGKYVYYRMIDSDNSHATYKRIEPLGYRNNFIEYEYGKSVDEITSVIEQNKKDYDPKKGLEALYETPSFSDVDFEYMPQPEEVSAEEEASLAAVIAYEKIYNKTLPNVENTIENDITSIEPNEEFRDANNDKICGGIPIVRIRPRK